VLADEFDENRLVAVRNMEPFDAAWHRALSTTLAGEWSSPEDEEAFGDL
jgi:hypothetical protein